MGCLRGQYRSDNLRMNRQADIEAFLLAAHRLAVSRLREVPSRIDKARTLLLRWRTQDGRTRSDLYWDEWAELLAADTDTLERAVCSAADHAVALRSVSPLGVLLTQEERSALFAEARGR